MKEPIVPKEIRQGGQGDHVLRRMEQSAKLVRMCWLQRGAFWMKREVECQQKCFRPQDQKDILLPAGVGLEDIASEELHKYLV